MARYSPRKTGAAMPHPTDPAAAFEKLVEEHGGALRRFALWLGATPELADDLVQETFLRAWRRPGAMTGVSNPRSWLRRILRNVWIDTGRRSHHELDVDDVEKLWSANDYSADVADDIASAESSVMLAEALFRLPFGYRAVVLLHDMEGLTLPEIAAELEIGRAAAKARLRRGRMMLVTALAQAEEDSMVRYGGLGCYEARNLISAYVDHELDAGRSAMLEKHLQGCPTCPGLYASVVRVQGALSSKRDPDSAIPPELATRIRSRVSAKGGGSG
ncbi:MAG: sigma-70 family RNA polymerase sigma factor [Actinomycetota bacterium]|nr:sigma-70 family RNA polymerase sigma factor [Actinomycetota bacterium]